MADVNWDNVQRPDEPEPVEKSGILGTIAFVIFLLVGGLAGGAYVNVVMLGERVRDIAVEACPDPTCAVEVRGKHADCFSANSTYGAPAGLADFQTPNTSPHLGIATVDIDAYRACIAPPKMKTLADKAAD